MVRSVDTQPIFAKLANTVVVILTTFLSGINGAPIDRVVDESSQWNAFDLHLEEKSIIGSEALTTRRSARLTHRQRSGPGYDTSILASPRIEDERMHYDRASDTPPHTSFGAGSTALSSLGHNASTPLLRS